MGEYRQIVVLFDIRPISDTKSNSFVAFVAFTAALGGVWATNRYRDSDEIVRSGMRLEDCPK